MAKIIPSLNQCLAKMTAGEKRLARRLESHLEDDYLCWFDVPVGRLSRYPDFIVLHPGRGLLILEVKDWKLESIKSMSKTHFELLTAKGLETKVNPIEQARQCTFAALRPMEGDPQLKQPEGKYQGKLAFPYGYGVVFSNINRAALTAALAGEEGAHVLPEHQVICKDEMTESTDPEAFQAKLWGMFNYVFPNKLTLPQIERIRWHLFPEIRVEQGDMFSAIGEADCESGESTGLNVPDVIRVMDLQQEQLARNLGEGHRVIHGVAGSGKTMILGFKALQLAQTLTKPILVLCFNISLAARLRHLFNVKGVGHRVMVYHFHDWCGQQIKTYHCSLEPGSEPVYQRQVQTVINSVDRGQIPREQYGAVLIDEGHDFEPQWLKLVSQMVDPATDSLLLLYDDAQSIYKNNADKKSCLKFSLSSVGIKARGRTTILRLNYRNSKEILRFAYRFAQEFIAATDSDDDNIPIIAPESCGTSGPEPVFKPFTHPDQEINYLCACVTKWLGNHIPANEIAIIVPTRKFAVDINHQLQARGVATLCMADKRSKTAYSPGQPQVTVLTIHSSKGLEFDRVILAGVNKTQYVEEEVRDQARLMYVGMTRAKTHLVVTASQRTVCTDRLLDVSSHS